MHFGSETGQTFTVNGPLAIADDPLGGAGLLLELMFDASLVVSTTGRLAMGERTWIRANRCCSGRTSTITVDGGISVDTGTTRLENVGLDLRGTVEVPDDGRLELTGGPVRIDQGATPGTTFVTGASFRGAGKIIGDLPAGALRLTPVGVLVIDGDYTANAGGTLVATLPTSSTASITDRLSVTGTARLAGRLVTAGTTRFQTGRGLLVLSAGQLSGRFACSAAPGFVTRQAPRTVSLLAIDLREPGCLVPVARRVLEATWTGRRTASLTLPAAADRVLLRVTVSRATRATRLTLSGGEGAAADDLVTGHVVVGLAAAHRLTARLDHRARVSIDQVGWF